MGLFDSAYERTTAKLSGEPPPEIQRHTHTFYVPPETASPGVFVNEEGEEQGFWLTLRSLSPAQELAIMNRSMPSGRDKRIKANSGAEMIRETMLLFHENKPALLGGTDHGKELTRATKEWLWNVLDQRGRNLVSAEYDKLTEPTSEAPPEADAGNE